MPTRSPVVSFYEGVEVVAARILSYTGPAPYIATIRGMSGIGKSHFGREVLGKVWFSRTGTLTKPHDLERQIRQKEKLDYILLEVDQYDNGCDEIIQRKSRDACGKVPDYRVVILRELASLLDENLTLQKMLGFFDLIVENPENPNYK